MIIPLIPIPDDALCQEASPLSVNSYIPCAKPAVAIIYHRRDGRGYYMCDGCADHNIRNRDGLLVSYDQQDVPERLANEWRQVERK